METREMGQYEPFFQEDKRQGWTTNIFHLLQQVDHYLILISMLNPLSKCFY